MRNLLIAISLLIFWGHPKFLYSQNTGENQQVANEYGPKRKGKDRALIFAQEMKSVLNLNEQDYLKVLNICTESANKVDREKTKKQSKELTDGAIRQIRNEKLLQLESLLGKEKMQIWKKHQKSKRTARNSQTELFED